MSILSADLLLLIGLTATWPVAAWWVWREGRALVDAAGLEDEDDPRQRSPASQCAGHQAPPQRTSGDVDGLLGDKFRR